MASPTFDQYGRVWQMKFSYYMHSIDDGMGGLALEWKSGRDAVWSVLWTNGLSPGDAWQEAKVTLPLEAEEVRFLGTIGSNLDSAIGLDAIGFEVVAATGIHVTLGPCEVDQFCLQSPYVPGLVSTGFLACDFTTDAPVYTTHFQAASGGYIQMFSPNAHFHSAIPGPQQEPSSSNQALAT